MVGVSKAMLSATTLMTVAEPLPDGPDEPEADGAAEPDGATEPDGAAELDAAAEPEGAAEPDGSAVGDGSGANVQPAGLLVQAPRMRARAAMTAPARAD